MELTGITDEYRIEMGSPAQPPELHADGIQLLDEALDGLLRREGADEGNVQLVDPDTAALPIACQRGFRPRLSLFFEIVHDRESACGAALLDKAIVPVPDVTMWPEIADIPSLDVMMDARARAVMSAPLKVRDGHLCPLRTSPSLGRRSDRRNRPGCGHRRRSGHWSRAPIGESTATTR